MNLSFRALVIAFATCGLAAADESVEVRVVDRANRNPIAARMHLRDPEGKPVKAPSAPFWRDHFVFQEKVQLVLPHGEYSYDVERGPEWRAVSGRLKVQAGANVPLVVALERIADLSRSGWWSGDMHIHRDPRETELHMLAEDLHVAPVITWWNDRNVFPDGPPQPTRRTFDGNRLYDLLAGEDEREGGALLFFNLDRPLPLKGSKREFPSPMAFLEQARQTKQVHIDIEKPFWWDVPVWIASGKVDSIGLAHNHMHRGGVLGNEAWGRPRDAQKYPGLMGNGRWTADIYFHALNAGIRLPPSAGSASGVLPNPVGHNRVYVHCGRELTWDSWFENLRRGRVVVTNGPLLTARIFRKAAGKEATPGDAEGFLPGHVFEAVAGESVALEVALPLVEWETIGRLEVIRNGEVLHTVTREQWPALKGRLPAVKFNESGWLAVRAASDAKHTYRFALTGPVYVQIGGRPRISRQSAQFFVDWVAERIDRIKIDDEGQREPVLKHHRQALEFWKARVAAATVD